MLAIKKVCIIIANILPCPWSTAADLNYIGSGSGIRHTLLIYMWHCDIVAT